MKSKLSFPADEGRHDHASSEWWYFNAHLSSETGEKYGLLFNFLRDHMLVMVADKTSRTMVHRVVVRGHSLESAVSKLDLSYGENWWREVDRSSSRYEMHCEYSDFKTDLVMKALKPPLIVNNIGKIPEGLLGYSYYYAHPRMEIEGQLEIAGHRMSVKGMGWVDRQWGVWEWSGLGKWTWFSIQLDNGEDMIGFDVMHPLFDRTILGCLNLSKKDGRVGVLDGFKLARLDTWTGSKYKITYGKRWSIKANNGLDLVAEADFADQELMMGFWEGSCRVEGMLGGTKVSGVAYFEQADPLATLRIRKRYFYLYLGALNRIIAKLSFGRGPSIWKFLPVT